MDGAARALRWLALAAAAYVAITLVRYYVPPPTPRFPVESAFFIFVAVGVLAVMVRSTHAGPEIPGPDGNDAGGPERAGLRIAASAVAFVLAAFVLYAPGLQVGLLSDDFVIARWAQRFELIHFEATGFVRPGVPLFWWMLHQMPGDFAVTAHAANLVLHAVNAALVSLTAMRLGLRYAVAVAAGAMFVLFPGLSEAVVWLSGVQDVLMATLSMTAVLLATAAEPKIVLAVVTSAAALLVKETAVVVPVLAALVALARNDVRRHWVTVLMLAGVSAAYVLLRFAAGVPSSFLDVGDWQYFVKQLIANAFAAVGAPWTDAWGRSHAGLALMRSIAILVLAAAAFTAWRRWDASFRAAAACVGWVLAAALPAFSLFYIGPQLEGSRYVYLPAAGFAILLALLIGRAAEWAAPRFRTLVAGLIAAFVTVPFIPAIRSDIGRWQAAAAVRQEVLEQVEDQADRWGCTTFAAEGEADSVSGAYVFRHGLAEALARPAGDRAAPCRVMMTNGALRVEREP